MVRKKDVQKFLYNGKSKKNYSYFRSVFGNFFFDNFSYEKKRFLFVSRRAGNTPVDTGLGKLRFFDTFPYIFG